MKKEKDELFDRKNAQGSPYDKLYFTDEQLKQGEEVNKRAAAGDITWDSAHKWWENTRAGYGYTGGEDGHGYTALQEKSYGEAPSYTNKYQNAINAAANAIMNRGAFTYDPNKDPAYQQYADSYTRQGQQAMQDTLAQVSARTGGLASSYAASASQQAYNNYMSALADKVPELRQLAYQMYMNEGDDLRQNMQMLQGLEQTDYGRYLNSLDQYNANRNFEYGREQDRIAQNNYLAELAYQKQRDDLADSRYDQEYSDTMDLAAAELVAKSGDFSGYKMLGLSDAQIAGLGKWYQQQNAPKLMGGGGGGGGTPVIGGDDSGLVSDAVMERIQSFTNQEDLASYLDGLEESGVIDANQADMLFATYLPEDEIPGLTNRDWTAVNNGGFNWGFGVDNNAVVKDQYGNEYRLDDLVDALVGNGMRSADAKEYVKNLQKRLGI